MGGRPFPPRLGFGAEVFVSAEAMRVVAGIDEGVLVYRQLLHTRGYQGIKNGERWTAEQGWPGAPVDLDWQPAPPGYPLSPVPTTPGVSPARVRRLLRDPPVRAVVIGSTTRREGTIMGRALKAPTRTIGLLEVALRVPSGPAAVVLAHPRDVQPIPKRTRR